MPSRISPQLEEVSDSQEERELDEDIDIDIDVDLDEVSSVDSGTDDSSEDEEGKEGRPKKSNLFPDPLSLLDHTADLNLVLAAKSISDAIQILCPDLPGATSS
jgi:hypothetical protein